MRWVAGFVVIAILASIPGLAFLALGLMLACEAKIARGLPLRSALPWRDHAPQLVVLFALTLLALMPLELLAGVIGDARVIDPSGNRGLEIARVVLMIVAIAGVSSVILRASRLVERGDLHLLHHFSLGLRGFAGAFVWLTIPTLFLGAGGRARMVVLLGAALMVPILAWLPLLQVHAAARDRLGAITEVRAVRAIVARAPLAHLLALVLSYGLTLVLHLGLVVRLPADVAWLSAPLFVALVMPGRLAVGWAYARGSARITEAPRWLRRAARAATVVLLSMYVFSIFLTQLVGAQGAEVLFAHPALLLPSR